MTNLFTIIPPFYQNTARYYLRTDEGYATGIRAGKILGFTQDRLQTGVFSKDKLHSFQQDVRSGKCDFIACDGSNKQPVFN